MKRLMLAVICAVLCFGGGSDAQAGIYNNSSTPDSPEDTVTVTFRLLDSLGCPVQTDNSDTVLVRYDGPGGATITTVRVNIAATCIEHEDVWPDGSDTSWYYTYAREVDDIDGSGLEGTWTWHATVWDSSLALTSFADGEFQVYATSNYSDLSDSTLKGTTPGRTLDVTATGAAGIDWANVENKTSLVDLTQTTVSTSQTCIVSSMGANTITAAVIQDGAIGAAEIADDAIDSATFADDAKTMIAIRADSGNVSGAAAAPGDAMTLQGDSLSTLMSDLDSALVMAFRIRDSLQYLVTATGFAVAGDPMTLQNDSLVTLMADLDSALVMIDHLRDSAQYLVTATGFAVAGDAMTLQNDTLATAMANLDSVVAVVTHLRDSAQYLVTATGFAVPGDAMTWANDSTATIFTWIDAIRDSLQYLVTGGASAVFTQAGADSIAAMVFEFIDDSPHDANYGATGAAGAGGKTIRAFCIDTSGTDDTISSVNVYILNSAQTSNVANGVTTGSPASTRLGLTASTDYNWVAISSPGYVFPPQPFTTTAGADSQIVDIAGYNISTTATPASHQTTLYGTTVNNAGDTLANCEVRITLTGATAMYSSTQSYPASRISVWSDSNGDWSATIIGSDSLAAYTGSGGDPSYCVTYLHPKLQNGGKFEACGLIIHANGSSTDIRDVLAQ